MPKPTIWTYNSYRAMLYRNNVRFAIVTPDGSNALSKEDTTLLLKTLNNTTSRKRSATLHLKKAVELALAVLAAQERHALPLSVKEAGILEAKINLRNALSFL